MLRALAAAAPAVVKLRARAGEQQTHRERHPYAVLWEELVGRGEVPAGAVGFGTGPMAEALAGARGLATVSSTAALEAVAAGRPARRGRLRRLRRADQPRLRRLGLPRHPGRARHRGLRTPDPDWLRDNYFHPDEDADWLVQLAPCSAGGAPLR